MVDIWEGVLYSVVRLQTLGSLSIDDEWDDDDGIMTSCLKKFDARVSFSAGKMKS